MCCAVPTYKWRETHRHTCILFFLFAHLSPGSHTYKPMQTHILAYARAGTHAHTPCAEPSDTDLLTGTLDRYSPATVTGKTSLSSVCSLFITLEAWGFRQSRQSQQGGDHIPFTVAPDLERQHNIHTAGQQKVVSFRVTILSTLSQPFLTIVILTALYCFVDRGEGSIASYSMAQIPESQISVVKLRRAYTCISHSRNVLSQRTRPCPLTDYGHTWHSIIWILSHFQVVVCHQDNIYISLSFQWTVLCALTKAKGNNSPHGCGTGKLHSETRSCLCETETWHALMQEVRFFLVFFDCKIKN